ncbi:hypothetical protein PRUPE_5G229000 [Prunus persica]|uniref:S-adenosylmethionine-dependent methyltransferase n=1 Tax=Prunus persica TaxID=3760 RepID=A0A251PCJ3_PRUPE|nr:hypothetical protein PRUPE_5G229000 [Prunus persica]
MAPAEESSKFEAYPMKSGDGPNSYANNSTYQRGIVDIAKELLHKEIAEKLDIEIFISSNTFHIADLDCSVGPNTFFAVQNILEAVELKSQSQGLNSQISEFQVFFNDHTPNDFNMLFKSLPQNRRYYAAGVPGSFYGRLFPKASIHFFHASFCLHWLSRAPKEVADKNSSAWNKGRIHYLNSREEVVKAYEAQHGEDMECFLHARAQEIVCGGLMLLIVPGLPHGASHSHTEAKGSHEVLGSCLMDMARKKFEEQPSMYESGMPVNFLAVLKRKATCCYGVFGVCEAIVKLS